MCLALRKSFIGMIGKVLIVDDVAMNVELLSSLVAQVEGLEPVGFDDPAEALAWCEQESPILVLVDFQMPMLNGAEFVSALRATSGGAIIPVVIVTGTSDRDHLLRALEAGATDLIRKPIDEIEVLARIRSLSQLGHASRRIAEQAESDELTGLANRRRFLARLEEEISSAERYGTSLSLVMFDVDHFKRINDTAGHAAGDDVLRGIADRMLAITRASDTAGRLGGEEFGWLLPNTGLNEAAEAAERLRRSFEAAPFAAGRPVTASFGVAVFARGDAPTALLRRADELLYRAKREGRNRVVVDTGPSECGVTAGYAARAELATSVG